ncbi:MAG TPA: methyltransferase domain-containing protein [Actinomycetota bacterium]|nr:methyltransferase domain-containing protein [Actinomycetota bacterium]
MGDRGWTKSRAGKREVEIWDALGSSDPDWGVLSDPALRHGGWGPRLDDFYASGERAIESVLSELPDIRRRLAIDWGSGTGRLTFALARSFDRVVGVDISSSMMDLARKRARERDLANVEFVGHSAFEPAGDADLIVSLLVLQHAPSLEAVAADLKTMASALAPEGRLVVQLPRRALSWRARLQLGRRAWKILRALGVPIAWLAKFTAGFGMLLVSENDAKRMLEAAGLAVLETSRQPGDGFEYATYGCLRLDVPD